MAKYLLFLVGLIFSFQSFAQLRLTTHSSKANRYYSLALKNYREGKTALALSLLDRCEKYDANFVELWLLKGDIQHSQKDTAAEIASFKKAISINPDFFPNVHFLLGELLMEKSNYKEALIAYQQFLKYPNINSAKRKKSERAARNCKYMLKHKEKGEKVDFYPLTSVNTRDDEYWPFVSASGEEFFFTRKSGKGKYENENIYKGDRDTDKAPNVTKRLEDHYGEGAVEYKQVNSVKDKTTATDKKLNFNMDYSVAVKSSWKNIVPFNFNTSSNEGNISMTADGKRIYFGACDRSDGYGSFDIYMSIKKGDKWSDPINVGQPLNTKSWDSQPSISPDGRTLYFASNRAGGKGFSDIWVSKLVKNLPNGRQLWSKPKSLSFNTTDYDMAPFVHFDNSTLFFSSKGLPGMGGLDIYKVVKKDKGWGEPVNIGVNNEFDNIGFAVSPDGTTAYFSSVTKRGDRDIFYFNLPKHIRITPIIYLYGNIIDKKSGKLVKARMQLTKYAGSRKAECIYDKQHDANYSLCLPCKEVFCMNVVAKGYEFYSEKISLSDSLKFTSIKRNVMLNPISLESKICLSNIYFDFDSYKLKKKSYPELQRLKEYLLLNNHIKIEIGGHTDDRGSDIYNKDLSEKRAGQVYNYLVENGISKGRLQFKGYGSAVPVDNAKTEEARQKNRRTEIKVVDIIK